MTEKKRFLRRVMLGAGIAVLAQAGLQGAGQAALPGGTLDPTLVPKYVTPLVIPPAMPASTVQPGAPAADYNIAVRQFKQQILPGGIWDVVTGRTDGYPPTPIWSYGRAEDSMPDASALGVAAGIAPAPNSTFNYPAFTVEAKSGITDTVRWINDLVDPATGGFLPHLLAGTVDQTLHWANPAMDCADGMTRTDCHGSNATPYNGPVPIVTHVHGSHVNAESDGYPEAWWLPAANNIPAGYATTGSLFDQFNRTNAVPGSAYYGYENDQPATTIWYHDHALGMTRLNVYAGPAGFWLIRGGSYDMGPGILPGPAPGAFTYTGTNDPNFDPAYRAAIREIPIAIQDRSFNSDGTLFYPTDRAFFEGLTTAQLDIPFIGDPNGNPPGSPSDISPVWNPEAFFNTMVVNGTTWPYLNVAAERYRFRLLNGCNSRFINLSLRVVNQDGSLGAEVPFYQIGAEQGFLPNVVQVTTGFHTVNGVTVPAPHPDQALLMSPAERADVIVDFSGLANGTRIRMVNSGPDTPFGGFPIDPVDLADTATTGQVMEFVVDSALNNPGGDPSTPVQALVLPAEPTLGPAAKTRQLSLNEAMSMVVCAKYDPITGEYLGYDPTCADPNSVPFGPQAALLGTVSTVAGVTSTTPLQWMAPVTETPLKGDTETWEIINLTEDAHPIHLHLVRFAVLDRQPLVADPVTGESTPVIDAAAPATPALDTEEGYKDTVITYPGEVTRVKAKFDRAGLYVWHCHIVEHEDNEMMRPYVVRHTPDINGDGCVNRKDLLAWGSAYRDRQMPAISKLAFDLNDDGTVNIFDARYLVTRFTNPRGVPCN